MDFSKWRGATQGALAGATEAASEGVRQTWHLAWHPGRHPPWQAKSRKCRKCPASTAPPPADCKGVCTPGL